MINSILELFVKYIRQEIEFILFVFRRTETETSNEFSNRSRVAQQGKMKMSKCNKDIISRRLDNQQIEATGFGDNKILFDSSS